MKKTYTQILFSLTSLLLLISCDKTDCNKKDIYYNVRDVDKSMLPYLGYDTLTYIRTNVGDTDTFIGAGKTTSYDVQSEMADCGNTFHYENYFYTYKSKNFNDLVIGQNIPLVSTSRANTFLNFNNQYFNGSLYLNEVNLDSIIVLNKKYYNVQFIPDEKPYRAYFNKEFGCLKIIYSNGDTRELLSFKK